MLGFMAFFFFYANSLKGLTPNTLSYYEALKTELLAKGYRPKTLVISGKRAIWHNQLLTQFGAASKSQHLVGTAIDIIVLDINNDGKANRTDVDIVVKILESIVGQNGGIGTYISEKAIWNRQMVHFDSRGKKARWHR